MRCTSSIPHIVAVNGIHVAINSCHEQLSCKIAMPVRDSKTNSNIQLKI